MKKYPLIVLSLLSIVSCSEKEVDPKQAPVKIFTLNVAETFGTSSSDDWLILHDVKGKLLFSQRFESGESISFETADKVGDKINVTIFRNSQPQGLADKYYDLTSYLQIATGDEWTLMPTDVLTDNANTKIGNFDITVTNVDNSDGVFLTDKYGKAGNALWSGGTYSYNSQSPMYTNASSYLLTIRDLQDNIRYKFFDNVKDKDSYTISFLNMAVPESIMDVSFAESSQVSCFVTGFESGQAATDFGYWMYNEFNSKTRTKIKIGYLNRLPVYSIFLSVGYTGKGYSYFKHGAKPTSINFPVDATFTLNDKTLNTFAFTSNVHSDRRESRWEFRDMVNTPRTFLQWIVNGSEGEQRLGDLPAEFTTLFPELKVDKFKHVGTTFYTTGDSYANLINTTFKGHPKASEVEYYSVTVN
jgi:hypothetical protein